MLFVILVLIGGCYLIVFDFDVGFVVDCCFKVGLVCLFVGLLFLGFL